MNDADISVILESVSKILPSVEDRYFAEALRDRVHGVIDLLAFIINFHHYGKDGGATVQAASELGNEAFIKKEGDINKTERRPLSAVPYEARKDILRYRRNMIELDLKAAISLPKLNERIRDLKIKNSGKFTEPKLLLKMRAVRRSFAALVNKIGLHPYLELQYWNVFMGAIDDMNVSDFQHLRAFSELSDLLVIAEDAQGMTKAINAFRKAIPRASDN